MTVGVGALAADSDGRETRAVVVCSDRMVTWGHTEFEHDIPKIIPITDRIVALMAGAALRDINSLPPAGGPDLPPVHAPSTASSAPRAYPRRAHGCTAGAPRACARRGRSHHRAPCGGAPRWRDRSGSSD